MLRAVFEKKGNAIWISHLDSMRLFQRAFKRAGLHLKHTQGFNPRPSVSIALPMAVGVASCCELLDFEIEDEGVSCEQIAVKLNNALISGVKVLEVYEGGRKQKEIALLQCAIDLHYKKKIPAKAQESLEKLFAQDSLVVTKNGKNGPVEQDIIPMIKDIALESVDAKILRIRATVCCQNPALNPAQLVAAIAANKKSCMPEYVEYLREEIFDDSHNVFR